MSDKPYKVECDDNGCEKCACGRTWTIVDTDGNGGSTSYGNQEEAEYIAEMLNVAYEKGAESATIRAEQAERALAGLLVCSTCGGQPHASGKVCICGGTGQAADEMQYLRDAAWKYQDLCS